MRPADGGRGTRGIPFVLALLLGLVAAGGALAAEKGGILAVSPGIAPCVEEIVTAYVAEGGQAPKVVKEATGVLARQIDQGAPYDLLVAADPEWPEWLAGRNKLVRSRVCAVGRLVLWVPSGAVPPFETLGEVKLAVPDPETTSHGKLAREFLKSRGLYDRGIEAKRVILVGNAVQGVAAARSGAVQGAFIPQSLATTAGGAWKAIPDTSLPTVAGLRAGGADPNAVRLYDFLASDRARKIWERWGFEVPAR